MPPTLYRAFEMNEPLLKTSCLTRWPVWPVSSRNVHVKNTLDRLKVTADECQLHPIFPGWGFMVHLLLPAFPLTLSLQSKISPKLDICLFPRSGGWQEREGRVRQVSSLITRCTQRLANSDMWLKGLQRRRTTRLHTGSPGGALGMRSAWEPRK